MSLDVNGAGKVLTDAQISALKTVVGDETKAQELLDLFGSEDNDVAGFADEAKDLGFSEDMIGKIMETDEVFKGLMDGSLTIEQLEAKDETTAAAGTTETAAAGEAAAADGTATASADGTDKKSGIKTREELKALEDEAIAIKKEIDQLDSDIANQKAKIEEKKKELEEKKAELKEKEAILEQEKEKLTSAQAKLDEIKENIKAKEQEKKDTEEAIKEKQEQLIAKAEQSQAETVRKARNSYDEERDGDWNSYLMKKLDGLSLDPALQSEINVLTNKLTGINMALSGLNGQLTAQQTIVNAITQDVAAAQSDVDNLNNAIETIGNEISNSENDIASKEAAKAAKQTEYDAKLSELESAKALVTVKDPKATTGVVSGGNDSTLSQDDIKKMIPEKEFALVEKYGIDLSEKLADGSPRYVFAQGHTQDYHIYDMGDGRGTTLARQYEPGGGFDVVPSGSGYMNNYQEASEGNGRPVYYFCGDNVKQTQGCYTTSSPLSLDLDGDGVKTSDEIVEFDIDGDGVVDKINNSADGVLVFDKDGDGISGEDGSECFGDNTDIDGDGVKDGYKDGFEALKAFARDKGLINDADDMVLDQNDIKYLEENFGFGIKAGGYTDKTQSLTDLGITEINLAKTDVTKLEDNFDGNGNQLMTQEGATFVQNGETKEYADIWHRKLDEGADVSSDANTSSAISVNINNNNAFNTGFEYDNFIDFDTESYTDAFSIKAKTSFNFRNINIDKPQSAKANDEEEKKKPDEEEKLQ